MALTPGRTVWQGRDGMAATVGAGQSFGALLRRYRQQAALSQEELAGRAGLSVDAVSTLERGRRGTPRPDTLTLLVKALAVFEKLGARKEVEEIDHAQ
jgi:transcriptional regulator with XRE-family HTH domain